MDSAGWPLFSLLTAYRPAGATHRRPGHQERDSSSELPANDTSDLSITADRIYSENTLFSVPALSPGEFILSDQNSTRLNKSSFELVAWPGKGQSSGQKEEKEKVVSSAI